MHGGTAKHKSYKDIIKSTDIIWGGNSSILSQRKFWMSNITYRKHFDNIEIYIFCIYCPALVRNTFDLILPFLLLSVSYIL